MGTLINDCDECFINSIAQELIRLVGTTCRVYQFEQSESIRDPLYDEPVISKYKLDDKGDVGIEMPVFFKAPDRSAMTGEEGYRLDRISAAEFAVKDFVDKGLRQPRNGDIIKVWNTFYEVTNAHKNDSQISDSGTGATMYRIDLVRRTKAPPEGLYLRHEL